MRKFLFILVAVVFCGCTSTYKYDLDDNTPSLEQNKSIAIAVSDDGSYGSDVYTGSGRTLSNEIKLALKPYANRATILRNMSVLDDFSDEEIEKYDYIVIPEIIHWEDRATAWSGIPDKVEISVEIYNSQRELLKSAILQGKSASMTLSTNDPSELLKKPLEIFFKSAFEVSE